MDFRGSSFCLSSFQASTSMAAALAASWLSSTKVDGDLQESEIRKLLKSQYEDIDFRYPLTLKQVCIGDVEILSDILTYGAVVLFHPTTMIQADANQDDIAAAWADYQAQILVSVRTKLNEAAKKEKGVSGSHVLEVDLLPIARKITEDIVKQQTLRFPHRPTVAWFFKDVNNGVTVVSGSDKHSFPSGDVCYFQWEGNLSVSEDGNARFATGQAQFRCHGTVTLKLLWLNDAKMANCEKKLAATDPELLNVNPFEKTLAGRARQQQALLQWNS
eukprot:TRINITY_DN10_c0_g1_i2.p1 TRINITY_DN10_c0_g1~~TRINITY_DN10_c0_g1_i2.p1  ORF type:complete len:274 (-),score=14.99 TRINITY_DN10_c0_g1_i2:163-984(-)